MRRRLIRLLIGYGPAAVMLGGCAPNTPPEARVGLLLEEADILAAVFRSAQAPIATDPFCVGIAAPDMHTVGRFVAGLLAAHERDRANWVQIWTGTENPPGLDPRRDVHQRGRRARWSRLGHSISTPSGRRSAGRSGELPLFHGMV